MRTRPAIVVVVVINIGITRRLAAYMVACNGRIPARIRCVGRVDQDDGAVNRDPGQRDHTVERVQAEWITSY